MKSLFIEIKYVYFSQTGRISRLTWWTYSMPLLFVTIGFIVMFLSSDSPPFVPYVLLFLMFPNIMISIKRLHDLNIPGIVLLLFGMSLLSFPFWFAVSFSAGSLPLLLYAIPFSGPICLLIICGFIPGTKGENKFGSPSL